MDTKKIKKSFVRNTVPGQSGIACVASIINYHGGSTSAIDLLKRNQELKGSLNMLKTCGLAKREGLNANGYAGNVDYLKELEEPAILHIQRDSGEEDFVVFYGCNNNKFIIGDPGWGILEYHEDEIKKVWKSKAFIEIEPNEKFQSAEDKTRLKRKWVLQLLKEQRLVLMLIVVFSSLFAVAIYAFLLFMERKIREVTLAPDFKYIVVITTYLLLSVLAVNVLILLKNGFADRGETRFAGALQQIVFGRVFSINHMSANQSLGLTNVLSELASSLTANVFFLFYHIPLFVLLFALLLLQIGVENFLLTITCFIIPFILIALLWLGEKKITNAYKKYLNLKIQKENLADISHRQLQQIKLLNGESMYIDSISRLLGFSLASNRHLNQIKEKNAYWSILFPSFAILYFFLLFVEEVMGDKLVGFTLIGIVYFWNISTIRPIFTTIIESRTAFSFFYATMTGEKQSLSPSEKTGDIDSTRQPVKHLEVKNLKVSYPVRISVLSNVSFRAEIGKLTVVRGDSCSGKSTLVAALARLIPLKSGDILIDEQSWFNISDREWRNIISVVLQPIELLDGTVIENIAWGQASLEADKIIAFCKETGFDKFFEKLPDGYVTQVQRGVGLSSAEKQLVALATALYRDPQVLLLDDPLLNFDSKITAFILELLHKFKNEIVMIVFTSDKAIVDHADNCVEISEGK